MNIPLRVGILTASDRASRGEREDQSGLLLKSLAEGLPAEVIAYQVVPDNKEVLSKFLCHLADRFGCDLVLTTGGTGLSPRDVTPEATREVIEKEIPGISETIRQSGLKKTAHSMLSRGLSGVRGKTLIVNFPGSPAAVEEAFEVVRPVLRHASDLLNGRVRDCQHSFSSLSSS